MQEKYRPISVSTRRTQGRWKMKRCWTLIGACRTGDYVCGLFYKRVKSILSRDSLLLLVLSLHCSGYSCIFIIGLLYSIYIYSKRYTYPCFITISSLAHTSIHTSRAPQWALSQTKSFGGLALGYMIQLPTREALLIAPRPLRRRRRRPPHQLRPSTKHRAARMASRCWAFSLSQNQMDIFWSPVRNSNRWVIAAAFNYRILTVSRRWCGVDFGWAF